jgi:hypothetical protein
MRRTPWQAPAAYGWVSMEVLLFTLLLFQGQGPKSALLVCYFLLLGGAALRFRIELVWYATGSCLTSYWALIYVCRDQSQLEVPIYASIVFSVSLTLMSLILYLLLRRVRAASRDAED